MTVKVLVGSENPVKIAAVKEAFSKFFNNVEVVGMKVNSNVPDQPVNMETFEGAKNRVLELMNINKEKNLGAKFFVGIEGGIIEVYSRWFAFGGMCVGDEKGRISFGTSPHFELPKSVVAELLRGVELGLVMDKIQGDNNTKQKHGAIGYFTKGVVDRKELYTHGLVMALIPFLNDELYFDKV